MRRFFCFFLILLVSFGCNDKFSCRQELKNDDSISSRSKFRDSESLNREKFGEDSLIITSRRIGPFYIDQKLEDVILFYPNSTKENYNKEGLDVLQFRVQLFENNELVFVASEDKKTITRITTESSIFNTLSGLKVGDSIKKIYELGDEVNVASDVGDIIFELNESGIRFKVDKGSENKYFEEGGELDNLDSNAIITSFEIIKIY